MEGRKDRWRTSCLLRQLQDRRSTRTWCGSANKSPCFLKPFTENGAYRPRFLRRSPAPSTQNKASLSFSHLNLTSMERHWLPSLSPLYRQEYQGSERLSDSPTVTQLVWDAVRLTTPSRSHSLMLQRTHRRTTGRGSLLSLARRHARLVGWVHTEVWPPGDVPRAGRLDASQDPARTTGHHPPPPPTVTLALPGTPGCHLDPTGCPVPRREN